MCNNTESTAASDADSTVAPGSPSNSIPIANSQPIAFDLPINTSSHATGPKVALLLIDLQGDFCNDSDCFITAVGASPASDALLPAQAVLAAARRCGSNNVRIIHTLEAHLTDLSDLTPSKHRRTRTHPDKPVIGEDAGNGRMLVRGSPCNGLREEVAFVDGEIAIHKPGKGSFYNTELMAHLNGISHVLVCGVTTECCVQTTMRDANDRGFELLLIEDATSSCVPRMKDDTIYQLTAFGAIVGCAAKSVDVVNALDQLKAAAAASVEQIPPTISSGPVLPVIDVSPLMRKLQRPFADARCAVDAECLEVAAQIDHACRTVGFFYVRGHGLDPPLHYAREFFALPLEAKLAIRSGAGEGAGYEPAGAQVLDEGRLGTGIDGDKVLGDRKESFIIGKSAPSQRCHGTERIEGQWPQGIDGFREALIAYHDTSEDFLRTLLRGAALGLGLAADTFDCFTKDSMTKVRLLCYPSYSEDKDGYSNAFGCGTHTDWGAFTLLSQDDVGGLEVHTDSGWVPAPNIPGALLVNVGDMLKLWTRDRYRSAPHRVVKPAVDTKQRYSIAVFYNFDHDVPIDPRMLLPNQTMDDAGSSRVLTAEEYILERVRGTY